MIKASAVLLLCLCFGGESVFGKGLREEFTWTRIGFVWPTGGRFGGYYGGGGGGRGYHHGGGSGKPSNVDPGDGAISYPGDSTVDQRPQQTNNVGNNDEVYRYGKS